MAGLRARTGRFGQVRQMKRIPLCVPVLKGNEARYLAECVDTGFVSSVGPFVERFENEFAKWVGARYAVACASGTAALHVSLLASGALPGTTVPVADFSFIASVNSVVYTGATPLLVDSEPTTWNMDTELLHDHVVSLARAGAPLPPVIEVVHILGTPARIEPLLALRERFGIKIVEDAAESLGATFPDGRQVGTAGELGCFSFNGNKLITCGGGGMIVTNDADLAQHCRHLTTQAKLPGPFYRHDAVGFNYRLTNVAAAVGLAQLEQIDTFLETKRKIAACYRSAFASFPVSAPHAHPGARASHWLSSFTIDHDDRAALVATLDAAGVDSRPVWQPAHEQLPHVSQPRLGSSVAERLGRTGVSLPSSADLSDADIDRVTEAVQQHLTPVTSS